MNLIPYETLTINTSLHPEEALHKMQAVIEPKRIFRWWLSVYNPYEVTINGYHFTASRILSLGYHNPFKPIIHGDIQQEVNGSSIYIILKLNWLGAVIMAIWFGPEIVDFFSFIVNLIGSVVLEGKQQPNLKSTMLMCHTLVLGVGYGFMMGGFIIESAISKAFFRKLFQQC